MNWLLTVSYDGTMYSGWQVQPNKRTVQGEIQSRLEFLYGAKIDINACSRTDAGVHALAQKASFSPPPSPPISLPGALKALNSFLPKDIRIRVLEEKEPYFHARHNCVGKVYTYLLHMGNPNSPFIPQYYWPTKSGLNLSAMRSVSKLLIGTHDFSSFSVKTRGASVDPIRTIFKIEQKCIGNFIMISIHGKSFLYKMVRRIIGFLVKVGQNQIEPEILSDPFLLFNSKCNFDTAPPQGLFLESVFYDRQELDNYTSSELPFLNFFNLPVYHGLFQREPSKLK